jgi:hypothetical protein
MLEKLKRLGLQSIQSDRGSVPTAGPVSYGLAWYIDGLEQAEKVGTVSENGPFKSSKFATGER